MSQPEEHQKHDAVSYGRYILIWLGLIALTRHSALAGMNLGRWVIITALGIASVKSMLVLNIFMHLKFEDPFFGICCCCIGHVSDFYFTDIF